MSHESCSRTMKVDLVEGMIISTLYVPRGISYEAQLAWGNKLVKQYEDNEVVLHDHADSVSICTERCLSIKKSGVDPLVAREVDSSVSTGGPDSDKSPDSTDT